jgi:hypothetical protein
MKTKFFLAFAVFIGFLFVIACAPAHDILSDEPQLKSDVWDTLVFFNQCDDLSSSVIVVHSNTDANVETWILTCNDDDSTEQWRVTYADGQQSFGQTYQPYEVRLLKPSMDGYIPGQ